MGNAANPTAAIVPGIKLGVEYAENGTPGAYVSVKWVQVSGPARILTNSGRAAERS